MYIPPLASIVMSSPRVFLSASLLTALQFVLSVDGKGGGRGSSYRSGSGSTTPRPVVYRESGRCYDEQSVVPVILLSSISSLLDTSHVEMKCPAKNNTLIIIGIVFAVIAGNLPIRSQFLVTTN